jgi:AcrR family transcriptional regulator
MNEGINEIPRKRLTRAQAKAQTRALLLEAAAHTFARKGFAKASVEEIAEAAGFSTGALYSNFGSKDGLSLELLSERATDRVSEAARILGSKAPEEEAAHRLGRLLSEATDKDPYFAPLQAEFWLYAVRNREVMKTLAARSREPRDALAALIARRLEHPGETSGTSSTALATVVLALFQGLVQQRRTDPATVPDALFGQALHWLFTGMAALRRLPARVETSGSPDPHPPRNQGQDRKIARAVRVPGTVMQESSAGLPPDRPSPRTSTQARTRRGDPRS